MAQFLHMVRQAPEKHTPWRALTLGKERVHPASQMASGRLGTTLGSLKEESTSFLSALKK